MSFLLDTNVLSEMRKRERRATGVQAWLEAVGWDVLATSWVVIGEMRHGAHLVRRRDAEQARALDAWIDYALTQLEGRIYPVDRTVVETWARLGIPNPLPTSDGLIAATAITHGLVLATRNVRDFRIAELSIIDPWVYSG